MDGGRVAARGFLYQYLRTLEQLVAAIDEPQVAGVRVEGPPPGDQAVDKVDFDVVDADGTVRMAVQVKSRVAGGSMSGALALVASNESIGPRGTSALAPISDLGCSSRTSRLAPLRGSRSRNAAFGDAMADAGFARGNLST
ncbi:hypothetical protein [Streptomyces sp. NPDC003006]